MRIGIFFGGASREREISFAGGRTVYDNIDKNLFEPIPIFVDSLGNFIVLNWRYIYKGSIRDFYPPASEIPKEIENFQIYIESIEGLSPQKQEKLIASVGRKISIEELKGFIDFAFLALHGAWGEDGSIQGLLEWLKIPYSGSGILPSSIGMNKAFQKNVMRRSGFEVAESLVLNRNEWLNGTIREKLFTQFEIKIGLPFVVRPANQGSSIGVSIVDSRDISKFTSAVDGAFFIRRLSFTEWRSYSEEEKTDWVIRISEIKDGAGIPFLINGDQLNHPSALLKYINEHFLYSDETLLIESIFEEQEVLIESFIDGIEFSCIVIRNENGDPIALPPTEIKKGKEVFDYRSKYLPGMARKVTPIDLPANLIEKIRTACEELFKFFSFHVYARIDGFVRPDDKIFLNDPNTTSGMLPSSFFFHQVAEIGLNPSEFLTYIIRTSIYERVTSQSYTIDYHRLLTELDQKISELKNISFGRKKIAVILGGYSSERHISVESGRNIYEKLSSSTRYHPIPVFLMGTRGNYELYHIPINLLLKDNADDIRDKILNYGEHPTIEKIKKECLPLTLKYSSATPIFRPQQITIKELSTMADAVFIALHGRPGEDGELQRELEKFDIPYNGSGVASSQVTINKYETNEILREHGFMIASHLFLKIEEWQLDKEKFYHRITNSISFPFICKPIDDGCSSAVKKIQTYEALDAFCQLLFRDQDPLIDKYADILDLNLNEEFPSKNYLLVEELITAGDASHFLEITGGMLTTLNRNGEIQFEVFEPSEALATDDVLSLEEKFLAGQGQNITPARFADNKEEYLRIAGVVKAELERAARILNVMGYCRIDAFVRIYDDGRVETIIIEVNSLPGMTPATCIFHQAAINNYKPFDFIDKILEFSFAKKSIAAIE